MSIHNNTKMENSINELWLGDCLDLLPNIQDLSVDLSIIDPPYFGIVKEDWDNQWSSLEEYYSWCNKWITHISRVTRYSGSVYVYGCSKNLLTLSTIGNMLVNNGLEFRQEIIIDKGMKSVSGRTSKHHKCFPMVSENILYFVKDAKPFIRKLLKDKQIAKGYNAKEMNALMGLKTNGGGNWTKYSGNTNFPLLPTKEHWEKLQNILDIDIDYNNIGITFNTEFGITNVWNDINFYNENRIHPTQKPINLANRLISVSSNIDDLVLDLFSGSANVAIAAKKLGRKSISVEKDPHYYEVTKQRVFN